MYLFDQHQLPLLNKLGVVRVVCCDQSIDIGSRRDVYTVIVCPFPRRIERAGRVGAGNECGNLLSEQIVDAKSDLRLFGQ